ncbi:MAG: LCP family protein [Clostridia bacterium]|nr:LCP family protein [Clostridia bacterium]
MPNKINDQDDVSMYYPDGDAANMERDDHDNAFINQNIKKKNRIKKKNARLTKSQIALIAVIFLIYTAVIFAAAWLIFYQPVQPGQNELPFEANPSETTDLTRPPLDGNEENSDLPVSPDPDAGKEDEYVAQKGLYNILVIGHDDTALLADVVMIVNCDTNTGAISVMQIPRDTLVTIGLITNKNNEAFSHYYVKAKSEGLKDPYAEAGVRYASLLEKSLCINIHNTVIMNLAGFRAIVDAIGGVDVNVPQAMHYEDPEQDLYINIGEGWQHLDGYNAEGFIRFRDDYMQADLGRVNAQKIFLTAMFNKVKSVIKSADVGTIASLADAVFKSVSTDLTVADIIYYAKFLLDVNLENINMMTIPGDVADAYYVINRQAALGVINQYFNIYNKDITDSIFDPNYTFCFTSLQYLCDVYFAGSATGYGDVYNGESINDESIYIPRN